MADIVISPRSWRWIRYGARALALVWGAWWTFFGLASGLAEGLDPLGVMLHTLVPGLIFLFIAMSTYRWELFGAVALVLAGFAALVFFFNFAVTLAGMLTLVLPPILAGILLLLVVFLEDRYARELVTH